MVFSRHAEAGDGALDPGQPRARLGRAVGYLWLALLVLCAIGTEIAADIAIQ